MLMDPELSVCQVTSGEDGETYIHPTNTSYRSPPRLCLESSAVLPVHVCLHSPMQLKHHHKWWWERQRYSHTSVTIYGCPVESVSRFLSLGADITENLTWTTHTSTLVKKARQRHTVCVDECVTPLSSEYTLTYKIKYK